jgi:hypothetical protein
MLHGLLAHLPLLQRCLLVTAPRAPMDINVSIVVAQAPPLQHTHLSSLGTSLADTELFRRLSLPALEELGLCRPRFVVHVDVALAAARSCCRLLLDEVEAPDLVLATKSGDSCSVADIRAYRAQVCDDVIWRVACSPRLQRLVIEPHCPRITPALLAGFRNDMPMLEELDVGACEWPANCIDLAALRRLADKCKKLKRVLLPPAAVPADVLREFAPGWRTAPL